jgi:hypothetical protein
LQAIGKSDNAVGMNAVAVRKKNDHGGILAKKRRRNKRNHADLVPVAWPRYSF